MLYGWVKTSCKYRFALIAALMLALAPCGSALAAFVDIGDGLTGAQFGSLAWGDYDGDGDLDLAVAGYTGTAPSSKIYRNDAGAFVDSGASLTGVRDCSLAWGDYDNDGDLDLALAGYYNDGSGH